MNSKNSHRNSNPKVTPKKKVKNNVKAKNEKNETKSKFYVNKDGSENEESKGNIAQKITNVPKVINEPPKIERAHSFFLTRKLSKIYTKISSSKENLLKVDEPKTPEVVNVTKIPEPITSFRFQRSLTLHSFQLNKTMRKPLEKLSEEKLGENDKLKLSSSPPLSPPVVLRSRDPTNFRQTMPPGSFDAVDFLKPPLPVTNLERSGSFISLIKRKISFNESKPPQSMSSNWATSLQNLQQIDNMVSYEDLSFVDYDKFNSYEQQVDKALSRSRQIPTNHLVTQNIMNPDVVRRRIKKTSNRIMDDVNSNLDREKNLYRQSIDSNKLRILSSINLDWSRAFDSGNDIDWLSLDNTPQAVNSNL